MVTDGMILAIPYSHKDIHQALRVLKWMAWLSRVDGESMRKEKVLLVPSRLVSSRGIHREICYLAARTFGEARCFVPASSHETGWPGSCNFMLKEALEHVETHLKDDLFLLEPDAIPLTPEWFQTLKDEWERARENQKHFLGNFVNYDIPHMTGIGVYGRAWRNYAPCLSEVPEARGWDTYAAHEIVPNAHFTPLIQHAWWNPVVTLEKLDPEAVVFHQDKAGRLVALLDAENFGGEADKAFCYSDAQPEVEPMTCFHTPNATRTIKAPGIDFRFERTEQIGGVWEGVFLTEDAAEIAALRSLTSDQNIGVRELSADECAAYAKKKMRQPNVSVVTPPPPPQLQITQSPAVLVADPEPSPTTDNKAAVEKIDDVLRVETVTMAGKASLASEKTKRQRGKKA